MSLIFRYIQVAVVILLVVEDLSCEDKYVLAGTKVELQCTSPSWTFKEEEIESNNSDYQINGANLIILNVTEELLGKYACNNETIIELKKGIKPSIVKGFDHVLYKKEGSGSLTLNCSIKGKPKVKVLWKKNNIDIKDNSRNFKSFQEGINDVQTASLTLPDVKKDDSGNYTCVAKNEFGLDQYTNDINIYAPPGIFTLSKSNTTSTSTRLRWTRETRLNETFEDRQIIAIWRKVNNDIDIITETHDSITGLGNFAIIDNLVPNTIYTFTVYEKVGTIEGSKSNITVTTLQDGPSPPRNVTEIVYKKSIFLKWEPPLNANGVIKNYTVRYKANTPGCTKVYEPRNTLKTEIQLDGLYSDIEYIIEIFGNTIKAGDKFVKYLKTLPDVPQAAPNIITHKKGSIYVNLTWSSLSKCQQGGEISGYHISITQLLNGNSINEFVETEQYLFTHFSFHQAYEVEIRASNNEGDAEKVATDIFYTPQGAPSAPENVVAHPIKNTIMVSWDRPKEMNGEPDMYQIVYVKIRTCRTLRCIRSMPFNQNFVQNGSTAVGPQRTILINRELDPFTRFEVKVREKTLEGGWGPYSNPVTVRTAIAAPSSPQNLTVVDVTHSSVTIEWYPPDKPNGIINSYHMYTFIERVLTVENKLPVYSNDYGKKLEFTIKELQSDTKYSVNLYALNGIEGDASDLIYFTTELPPREFPWIFVLIGCLAVLLLIVLLITAYLLIGRRKSAYYRGVKQAEEVDMNDFVQSKPVNVTELKRFCLMQHANSDHLFQQEFESLRLLPTSGYTFEHSQQPCNQLKNRYSNILPYDHSRVVLSTIENEIGSTYINANYIDGYNHPKKYIATQGPIPETVLDFWRMIWEQKCPVIVMLTKLVEDNRAKCEQYWPPGDGLQYNDVVVKKVSVNELTGYTIRVFQLFKRNGTESRIIRQYHYTAWPDHGVPSHPTSMLSFIRHVISYVEVTRPTINESKNLDGPVVVHCSAGVGRTGTFIAIAGCLKEIDRDRQIDVLSKLCKMRQQRNFMVQTESQYTFIYDALLDSYICGNTEIAPADLAAKMRFLNEKDFDTDDTNFVAEFKRLESGISIKDKDYYVDAGHLENKQKNRFLNILPYDWNRVKLVPIAGCRQSDYINASIIDGFQKRALFIATQAPLENSVNDFWRMIVEQNVQIIVMLTKLEEKGQEKCYLYWPQASTVSYGNILVGFIDFTQEDNLAIRKLRITNKENGKSWTVTHLMFLGWPEYGSPETGTEIIQLIGLVQRKQRLVDGNGGPIIVHCSGGVGRTGVFISVFNTIEQLRAKDIVDIFQTTRALRLQRTAMVQTIDQYMFCYQVLKDYLDSFDLYANPQC